ncbi:MAG: hypothetical protein S4CHLAM7_12570 [Chlamydiae bacterium]|nr:hypothetical protein [Chlamydiota bacterium]
MPSTPSSSKTIVSYTFEFACFKQADKALAKLASSPMDKINRSERYNLVSESLLDCIQNEKGPCFLLPAVLNFIDQVTRKKYLDSYTINSFEFWLNQFSELTEEENLKVRAKISGRYIPRDDYQLLFPIGMGKYYPGSHFVTGHGSPDLDTTVASFWGWLDAFSAKVSHGLHVWNLPPGGILTTQDAAPLTEVLGKIIFPYLSQNRSSLTLSGLDFTTQKDLIKKKLKDSTIDSEHALSQTACMIVDSEGYFLGDLRIADYESIRQIQALVTHCFIWFENVFHHQFITLFTKEKVHREDILNTLNNLFDQPINRCLDTKNLSPKFVENFNQYLVKILHIQMGLNASFALFAEALSLFSLKALLRFKTGILKTFGTKSLYDAQGHLSSPRHQIFKIFDTLVLNLDEAFKELQNFTENMDTALKIKKEVLGFPPRYVTPLATLDEIRDKMSIFNHLTVVAPNKNGQLWPLGIIHAKDLKASTLGTVSLRDFSNREEVKIASYFETISIVDHHKTDLKTKGVPVVITGDAQSSNVLVAEKSFEINDRYLLNSYSEKSISAQLKKLADKDLTPKLIRIQKRLLSHKLSALQSDAYFIHSDRVFLEYLSYLHAIIDDTDLFSKVTARDLYCTANILNRMKSILLNKEVEIIQLDHLRNEPDFIKKAVRILVEDPDMYSLYNKIFGEKESLINESIRNAAANKPSDVFSDTKEQNGCCRIGQTKIFSTNAVVLSKSYEKILHHWCSKASDVYQNQPEMDLHIHMISTIPNAEEVYQGLPKNYLHRDYLWIWIPNNKQALDHLASFLNAFKKSEAVKNAHMHFQILGNLKDCNYETIFKHHFMDIPKESELKLEKKAPIAILSFDAGTLNSRKAHITPYLPLLVK